MLIHSATLVGVSCIIEWPTPESIVSLAFGRRVDSDVAAAAEVILSFSLARMNVGVVMAAIVASSSW